MSTDYACDSLRSLILAHSKRGGTTNEANVEYLAATLDNKLNGYEAILSKQKYIAGNVSSRLILSELLCGVLTRRTGD